MTCFALNLNGELFPCATYINTNIQWKTMSFGNT